MNQNFPQMDTFQSFFVEFRCQLCNNATSNEACNKNGFQTCSSNEDVSHYGIKKYLMFKSEFYLLIFYNNFFFYKFTIKKEKCQIMSIFIFSSLCLKTCGTTVERASKRITKGCKPKGGCKPWCDGISCTFCCNSAYCNDGKREMRLWIGYPKTTGIYWFTGIV